MHDRLDQNGGAERMLWTLHEMFPDAPIYTAMWNRRLVTRFASCDVRTSWMQHLPGIERAPRAYAALYPLAFETMNLNDFDIVISLTTSFAKGVRADGATHICYCNSPSNFVWRSKQYFGTPAARWISVPVRAWLRLYDRRAAQRPDVWVTSGKPVANRIRLVYGKPAAIIPPGIEAAWFVDHEADDYYLAVGRLVPHKRVDLAIKACEQLGMPLVIVGDGRARHQLERRAAKQVHFTGPVSDDELRRLYARARAVLIPAEEDFGLVPLEAQAAGTPVIAFDAGGVRETVIDGVTGLRFAPQTVQGLKEAMKEALRRPWNHQVIQQHAANFTEQAFRRRFSDLVNRVREPSMLTLPVRQEQHAH